MMADYIGEIGYEIRIIAQTLFATFLILKLTGVIAWSWLWVLFPLIVTFGLAMVFLGLYFAIRAFSKNKPEKEVKSGIED